MRFNAALRVLASLNPLIGHQRKKNIWTLQHSCGPAAALRDQPA
jgi:hypothetical protein